MGIKTALVMDWKFHEQCISNWNLSGKTLNTPESVLG